MDISVCHWCTILLFFVVCLCSQELPLVLWNSRLAISESNQPVKIWVIRCWHSYLSGDLHNGPADSNAALSLKCRMGYHCGNIVLDKKLLNVCCFCSRELACHRVLADLHFRDQVPCQLHQHLHRLEYRIGLLECRLHLWCEFSRRYHQPLRRQVLQPCKQHRQVRQSVFMYSAVSVLLILLSSDFSVDGLTS